MDLNQQLTRARDRRAAAVERLEQIHQTATDEKRELSGDEAREFSELQATVRSCDAEVDRIHALLGINGDAAAAVRAGGGQDFGRDSEPELIRRCRLTDAIRHQLGEPGVDIGPLREWQQHVLRRDGGRAVRGMLVPVLERRALLQGNTGGNLIEEELRDDLFIAPLRQRTITGRAGATFLPNLVGDQLIPRQTGSVSPGFIGEDQELPEDSQTIDQLEMRQKHAGALTELSRNMVQGSRIVEQLVVNDLVAEIGRAIDAAAISGDGLGANPLGIVNQTGVGSVPFAADDPTWDEVHQMITAVDVADALLGSPAFAVHPTMAGAMRTTAVDAGSGRFVMEGNPPRLADYPALVSGLVPYAVADSHLVFGNWADLLIGLWSGVDILVNPFESSVFKKGHVLIRGIQTCDVAVRHPESFAVGGTSQTP